MTEHVLTWHPKVPSPALPEDKLNLLDMPTGLVRPKRQIHAAESLTAPARTLLHEVLAILRRFGEKPEAPFRISLRDLNDTDRANVFDLLGEGDVNAEIGGNAHWRILETVLTGLWRIEATGGDGVRTEWLEIASIPQPVLQAADRMTQREVPVPELWPAGAMNAPALITELHERSQAYQPGDENHVINFTLLPLTDVDAEVLTSVLGQIPLVIRSEGYGSCRIFASGLRHVWAVQYLNSMSSVILDTLEIGDVPTSALAAREDFEDSALRLAEILDAYSA